MSTVTLRNVNPLGYVDLPIINRCGPADDDTADVDGVGCLHPGEEFECPAAIAGRAPSGKDGDLGEGLLAQVGNFELVAGDPLEKKTIAELEVVARDRGVDLTGLTKKAEILAALKDA